MEVTGGVTGTRTGNFKFNIIGILDQKKKSTICFSGNFVRK